MSYNCLNILSLMNRWGSKREMMGDDPPYLAVGTEVSAKYKGAFCEAKVRKIVRSVKCKIAYKLGLGTAVVTDDQIKGTLRAGSVVEVKHSDKKEYVEASIIKIQDCSQYTVVFDDGDITTLRRTALCLKSGRHFAESETLDQLPLTHPEHFGNPVIGGRRGRRTRHDESSDDEDSSKKLKQPKEEKEADIGKVVCVEISEKKKQKDNWFPGLVVAPTAQDTVKINVKEDYLVRSFKDGRYYTVPKKEATPFTREIGQKVDNNTLKTAVEKALLFLDRDELPPHWDRELLFGLNEITDTDSDAALDSDTSDDEPREEKDHFVAQLYKFMDDRGTPINKGPTINGRDVDLYKLFKVVHKLGGYNRVTNHNQWKTVSHKLGFGQNPTSVNLVKHAYKKFLHSFEDFYRKLGCTMVNHPRGHRARHRSGRSLIRDKDKAIPSITKDKPGEKETEDKEESVTEPSKERETSKEEVKSKEGLSELKPQRESRKDLQKPKNEKVDKKEDVKVLPTVSKNNDLPAVTKFTREDRGKLDDREERLKMRELVKLDNNAKDESKGESNSKSTKDLKSEESQRLVKLTRREVKQKITEDNKKDEKDKDDKNKIASEREVRPKKTLVSNPVEAQCSSEELKAKKSRSLFSKITGSKRIKPMPDSKIPRTNKPLGLNSVRQKRTFSERMKAMVKKFKMKSGVKHLRQKSPHPPYSKDSEDKKKSSTEDSSRAIIPQLTRSKSKEEVSCKTRKPEVPNERKSIPSHPPHLERRQSYSKKRKDDDKCTGHDEPLDLLPNYKSVAVGDKLKVYYGPTHESKVTYEAKVLSSKEQDSETMYLVHYTGWNTRYDEWIKRGRIADNLSWSPGRAKRTRQHPLQQSGSSGCSGRSLKRSKGGSNGEAGSMVVARSTTPSSVTSSSSRTKSPAVSGVPRSSRSRARTRRASAHTHTDLSDTEGDDDYESDDLDVVRVHGGKDVSSDQQISSEEKDSKDIGELLMEKMRSRTYRPVQRRRIESGGDPEEMLSEPKRIKDESEEEGRTRSRSEKKKTEEITKGISEDSKKEVGDLLRSDRLRNKRKVVEDKQESGDEREIKQEIKTEESKTPKHVQEDKRCSDLKLMEIESIDSDDSKKKIKRKIDDCNLEEETKELQTNERRRSKRVTPKKEDSKICIRDEDNEQPKGREFDLNQIRSELKGIASNSKTSVEVVALTDKEEDEEKVDVENRLDNKASESENVTDSSPEDVYEFKEPEPFEFEVRSKCGDEKGNKLQRRTFGRMCEEPHSTSPVSVRRKLARMKSESPNSFDSNKSIKNHMVKLSDEESERVDSDFDCVETNKKDQTNSRPCSPEQKQKDSTEIDKKEEMSSKKACKIDTFLQPLSLFSELLEEEEGVIVEQDSDSRLIVSEPDTDVESQGPLFSHQQRDHEDLFPTAITQSSSVDNSQNKSPFSGFSERFDGNESKVQENSSTKKEEDQDEDGDEIEDDPIQSAIKRVQRAFAQSTGDDDSNDIDLLSELPDPTNKRDSFMSVIKEISSYSESSRESNESHNEENVEGQNSHSNHSTESDEVIQISNCSLIEEINLDSNDSESKMPEDKDVLVSNEEAVNKQSTVELKIDVESTKETLESLKDVVVKMAGKFEVEKEEGDDQIKECTKIAIDIEVKEEVVEDCQEVVEDCQVVEHPVVVTCTKEETEEEIEEQIEEMDEEVLLETIGVKKPQEEDMYEEEGNEDDEVVETADMVEETQKDKIKKEEVCEVEETESNLESLLCEETIPGSPAPSSSVAVENPPTSNSPELPFASAAGPPTYKAPPPPPPLPPPLPPVTNEAAPVMENTPPTTPESSLSPISNSPRGEQSGSSPVPENESSKSNRDSSEVDMDTFPVASKISHYSEEDTNCGVGNTNDTSLKKAGLPEEIESSHIIKKRRRSHKRSDENVKRIKMSHRSPRHSNVGSESDDDTSENSLDLVSLQSRSPRPSKYNFFVQLDPELDGSQRIAVLQQKLTELRKTYMSVKAELAGIDRRRKKLRRREREASVKTNSKSEVPCS